MKKIRTNLSALFVSAMSLWAGSLSAQCTNASPYGNVTAPAPGSTLVAASCQWAGEYCTIASVVSGRTYSTSSTVGTDYFTVRSGTSNGPVVAAGPSPLVWTANTSATYYIHCNTNASCGTANSCRDVRIGCYLPGCTNLYAYGNITAPTLNNTNVVFCNYAEEYATVSSVVAGNVYVSTSSIGTDFFTVRSGSSTGPVVATGLSPLQWTAQVAGTHFVHVNTNTLCGTNQTCRDASLTCIGGSIPPVLVANDQCTAAITMAINTSTPGTTIGATAETPAPPTCLTTLSQPGVWYRVVGNGNLFGASLCAASAWDSKIFVYTGSCGSWNCVTGNDDNGPLCSGAAASATWCSVPTTTYFILVTGYSSASTFTIALSQTVTPAPSMGLSLANSSVCPTRTTLATASGAITYSWSTGVTTATAALAPSVPTVYTVTGRDASGCGVTVLTTTVNVFTTPTISVASNTAAICPGGSFVITPTGATSYTYSGGSPTLTGSTATVSPIVNTIYTVSGTNANGCVNAVSAAGLVTVTTLSSPAMTVIATPTAICPGFSSILSVTGANSYTWTSPAVNVSALSVSPTVTTIYTVSGTGTTVCNGVRTITITVFPTPTVVATPSFVTGCALSSQSLSALGAVTYTWNGSITGATTTIQTPTANATYTVLGTNSSGCIGTTTIAVISNSLPIVAISPASTTICVQSFALFSAAGASTYVWNSSVTGNTVNLFHTASTTHTIVGTDALGCSSTTTVSVFANPLPNVAATPNFTTVCANTPVSFTASGAVTYTWSNTLNGNTTTFTPAISSQYNLSGTDANGCVNNTPITVLATALPSLTIVKPSGTVCANAAGSYTVNGAGTYTWSSGATGNVTSLTPTANTSYFVTGRDTITGCVNSQSFSVNTFSAPVLAIQPSASQSVCLNVSATYTVSGANSFTWNTGAVGPVFAITPTASAVYTVTGKNQQNCTTAATVSVKLYSVTIVSAAASSASACAKETLTLTGTGAQTYTWLPFNITGGSYTITPQATLQYTVVGTDANNCEGSDTVLVFVSKCTGIEGYAERSSQIRVYPNPSNGNITIDMPFEGSKTVKVYSMSGALITLAETTGQLQSMDLNGNAKGLYYIQIEANGSSARYKLIIE